MTPSIETSSHFFEPFIKKKLKKNLSDLFLNRSLPVKIWGAIILPALQIGCRFIYILVHSHFDLVSWPLALETTEPVSKPITQIALELINNHLI